jgi:ankyrin repeat protein
MDEEELYFQLGTAVERGDLGSVKKLTENCGADVNYRFEHGRTLLMIAAWYHHSRIMKYLVTKGADKNATTWLGYSALHFSVWHQDDVEVPQYLLDQGSDIEKADHVCGWTALHRSARYGHINVLSLLMSYGANLYAVDNEGRTPIDLAASETIKQAIRDEERNRDHRFKRIPAADLLPGRSAATASIEEQEEEEDESSGDDDDDDDDEEDEYDS